MKVKDLIEQLKDFDPELEVWTESCGVYDEYPLSSLSLSESASYGERVEDGTLEYSEAYPVLLLK